MTNSFQPISSLTSLGPKSEEILAQIGIHTAEEFLAQDPYDVYAQLHQAGIHIGLNSLYAFISAHEGISWLEVAQTRKEEIIMRLDDLGLAPK